MATKHQTQKKPWAKPEFGLLEGDEASRMTQIILAKYGYADLSDARRGPKKEGAQDRA